jgi:uncharacterized membrane protein
MIPGETFTIYVKGVVRYCQENPQNSDPARRYLAGVEFTEGPLEQYALIGSDQGRGRYTPSHTIMISAAAQQCYELLGAFERYPEWASGVEAAWVRSRYPDGRGKRVEFEHNFFLRKVRYTLDYTYDDQNLILSWKSAGADQEILNITGRYVFKSREANLTSANYQLDVTLSIIPSASLVKYVTSILMRKEMKHFRQFVEKQSQAKKS